MSVPGDIFGRYQQGLTYGRGLRAEDEARQSQSRLSELAQAAYSAPDEESRQINIGEAIGVDPTSGFKLAEVTQGNEDRKRKALVESAGFLGRLPPDQQAQAYAGIRGRLAQSFPDIQLPEDWAQAAPTVQAINQAYGPKVDLGERYKVIGGSLVDLQNPNQAIFTAPQRFLTESGLIEAGQGGVRELRVGDGGQQPTTSPQAGGVNFQIEEGIAPEPVLSAIRGAEMGGGNRPWTANTPDIVGGGVPMGQPSQAPGGRILPQGAGARAEQLELARRSAQRSDEASELARRSADRADRAEQRQIEAARTAAAGGGLSAGELKKVRDDFKGIQDVEGDFKALEDALSDVGPIAAAVDPSGQGRLGTSYNNARAGLHILYNTGVLQPGELPLLESALRDPTSWRGVLDPRTRPQIAAQLQELRGLAERRRQTLRETYPSVFGGAQSPASGGTGSGSAPVPGTIQDGYRFRGGNPADQSSWEEVR